MTIIFPTLNEDKAFGYGTHLNSQPVVSLRQMDEERRKEFWANLALRYCKGIGVRTRARLLNYFGSALKAVENRKLWKQASISNECIHEFGKEKWRIPARKEWDEAGRTKAGILLWTSAFYPTRLRELVDPPSYLYCLGDLSLLEAPALAVVGSRKPGTQGLHNAALISRGLSARGISVVSGMALGIDREAHIAALAETGKSIGVLGTGIDVFYPSQNHDIYARMCEEGLLLSEFMPSQPPTGLNFPIRNRLISGLSLGVFVVEAAERSGSLITAHYALEQNREIFAMAGKHGSPGCMSLINQGAHPVDTVNDIILELGDLLKVFVSLSPPDLDPQIPELPDPDQEISEIEENIEEIRPGRGDTEIQFESREIVEKCCQDDLGGRIMSCLEKGSLHIEELVLELDSNINEINSRLIFLELLGKIRRLPGARFEAL